MGAFADSITVEQLEADPYPIYARLRRESPLAWIPAADVWLATTWDLCAAIGTDRAHWVGAAGLPTLERVFGSPNVLTAAGDAHLDQRAGIGARLTPKAVTAYVDDLVRPIARRKLAAFVADGGSDLMDSFFEPVSVEALRAVMGLDGLVDADTLRRWFRDLSAGLGNVAMDPAGFAASDVACREIEELALPLLGHLRRHPDDSMLSHMIHTGRDAGPPRPDVEIVPSLKVIMLGGMQEPGHGAGTTMLGLLSEPEQLAAVVADLALIPAAVNEGLRWVAPIGVVERQAAGAQTVAGVALAEGTVVQLAIGSANRDESRYTQPDRFDVWRSPSPNQAFGNGAHFCSGHFFSRHVERIMLEELLTAIPGVRPDHDDPPESSGWIFRGPKLLPAIW